MYGRANPKPEPPKFDAEDMRNMRQAEETRLLKAREMAKNDLYWHDIKVEKYLGLETEKIKWKQNQTYVEIFVRLDGFSGGMSAHESAKSEDVQVDISRSRLCVHYKDEVIIDDKKLYKDIKVDLSTWVIVDNVLEICLLKFCRRWRRIRRRQKQRGYVLALALFGRVLERFASGRFQSAFGFSIIRNKRRYEEIGTRTILRNRIRRKLWRSRWE